MKRSCIYLDHAAATPVDPRVLEAMLPFFEKEFGNPSGMYGLAQSARKAVDEARATIAEMLHAKAQEIIFTGSGTESDNLAILGIARAHAKYGKHIIATHIEHHAVLRPLELLEGEGFSVTYVPCDAKGLIDPAAVERAIQKDTTLITVMYANNEIGTVQDVAAIGALVQKARSAHGTPLFHTDACQAPGFLPLNVQELGVDLMTLNGGKIYGPKGVGVLYKKRSVLIEPQLRGGGQEYRLRAGTENVPAIVGMAKALERVVAEGQKESARLAQLRDDAIAGMLKEIPGTFLNGDAKHRLPNNINISIEGVDAGTLLMRLDMAGIAVSSGSACTSGMLEPSHVIMALGRSKELAAGSVRITLGRGTTLAQLGTVRKELQTIVADLRRKSRGA